MTMRRPFASAPPRPGKSGPPLTTDGDKRTFDMRPKPSDDKRRADPRDRAIRPADTPEKLLDDPAE